MLLEYLICKHKFGGKKGVGGLHDPGGDIAAGVFGVFAGVLNGEEIVGGELEELALSEDDRGGIGGYFDEAGAVLLEFRLTVRVTGIFQKSEAVGALNFFLTDSNTKFIATGNGLSESFRFAFDDFKAASFAFFPADEFSGAILEDFER